MLKFKRTLLAAVLCFATYLGLVCRIEDVLLAKERIQGQGNFPVLEHELHHINDKRDVHTNVLHKRLTAGDYSDSQQLQEAGQSHNVYFVPDYNQFEGNEKKDAFTSLEELEFATPQVGDEKIEQWDAWKTDLSPSYYETENENIPTSDTLSSTVRGPILQHENHQDNSKPKSYSEQNKYESESLHFKQLSQRQLSRQRGVQFVKVGNLFVFGTYLDLRQPGNYSIKILSVKSRLRADNLVCYIFDGRREVKLYAQAYQMCENHGKQYEGWIFTCVLPQRLQDLPFTVTLASLTDDNALSKTMTTFELNMIPTPVDELTTEKLAFVNTPLSKSDQFSKERHHVTDNSKANTAVTADDADESGKTQSYSPKGKDSGTDKKNAHLTNTKQNNYLTLTGIRASNPRKSQAAKTGHIGVCVPPLFGILSLSHVINFIEMCKVLGADQVFMYLGNISAEIRKFLHYYIEKDDMLSTVDWTLPGNLTQTEDLIWYHGQLLAVQDCLYHNMADFNFLLFMDLDEMLIPQQATDWPSMIQQLFTNLELASSAAASAHGDRPSSNTGNNKYFPGTNTSTVKPTGSLNSLTKTPDKNQLLAGTNVSHSANDNHIPSANDTRHPTATFSFRSAFFDPARVPEEAEHILYFQHLHRTKSVSHVRNKLLVQPMKVFELGIHHLSRALLDEFKNVDVSENVALIHHYHACVKEFEPQMKCYPTKKDATILRYKNELTILSHKVINDASKLFA